MPLRTLHCRSPESAPESACQCLSKETQCSNFGRVQTQQHQCTTTDYICGQETNAYSAQLSENRSGSGEKYGTIEANEGAKIRLDNFVESDV
jgi:hypothetical protein